MKGNKAFTLVELIVVVSIITILGTIGFVSYTNYLTGVRDANRIATLSSIDKGLLQYQAQKNRLPRPDNYVEIKSGTNTIALQGVIGDNVLKTIGYSKVGTDPRDNTYYLYTTSKNLKYYQIGGFLEEESGYKSSSMLSYSHANEYKNTKKPVFFGKNIGIFFDVDGQPIHLDEDIQTNGLDTASTTQTYVVYLSDDKKALGDSTTALKEMPTVLKQGGKGCSTDGMFINCYQFREETRKGTGIGYTDSDATGGTTQTPNPSPNPPSGGPSLPSTQNPAMSDNDYLQMFRPSTASDYNKYTDHWDYTYTSQCDPSSMNIVRYNPGDTIDTYINSSSESNTIYIFSEGNYSLPDDIDFSSSARCVGIFGEGNVNLELSITSNHTSIQAEGYNTIISGIKFNGASESTGINHSSGTTTGRGLYVRGVINGTFFNIESEKHTYDGLRAFGRNLNIYNIISSENGNSGIQLGRSSSDQCNNCKLSNTFSFSNGYDGVYVENSSEVELQDITTYYNGRSGVEFDYSTTNSSGDNISSFGNNQEGISIVSYSNNITLTDIHSYSNTRNGIYTGSSASNVNINNGLIFNNTLSGIWISGTNTILTNLKSFNNTQQGIGFSTSSSQGQIQNIMAFKNTGAGISLGTNVNGMGNNYSYLNGFAVHKEVGYFFMYASIYLYQNNTNFSGDGSNIISFGTCYYTVESDGSFLGCIEDSSGLNVESSQQITINGTTWDYDILGSQSISDPLNITFSFPSTSIKQVSSSKAVGDWNN